MADFYGIHLSIQDHIAELRLTRPEALNGFDDPLHRSFTAALLHLRTLADVRCIILAADGPVFSAGGDFDYIDGLANDIEKRRDIYEVSHAVYTTLSQTPIPVVAAMHGDAIGLGATVVTSCDVIVTHPKTRLADPHVRVGLCAGDGGVASWSLAAGVTRAKRHLLTGDPLDGQTAWTLGLVTDLVDEPDQVIDTARKIARKIASLPPKAVQGTKLAFNQLTRDVAQSAFELSLAHEVRCLETEDLREAISAAKEKRPGKYVGY